MFRRRMRSSTAVHAVSEKEEKKADEAGGIVPGHGEVVVDSQPKKQQSKEWRKCELRFSEICSAELVPEALFQARALGKEAKLAWLRSQLIGSKLQIETPFGMRNVFYADYTASGRCLQHIEKFLINSVMPHYGNTHTEDSYVGSATSRLVAEASRFIKRCLGAGEENALIFCGSGTTAAIKRLQEVMSISIPSTLRETVLQAIDPASRWVVFVGPYEHHSNILSWRQSLAEVVEVPMDEQGMVDLAFLERALKDDKYMCRPKLGSFSACSNVTGILTETRQIATILHKHNAFACFDFASSGPYVKIDMRSNELDGYDAVFLSPHKFLGGPGTPGVLAMNTKLYSLKERPPSTAGGGVVEFVNGFSEEETLYLEDVEHREDAGTPQILQRIKTALTFWIKQEMGTELIEHQEQYFIKAAIKRLSKNPNIQILGNTALKRAAILSFIISTTEANGEQKIIQARLVVKLLNDLFGIQARGGCSCAGPYGHTLLNVNHDTSMKFRDAILQGYAGVSLGWARVSFAYFLTPGEFEFILAAIEFIAMHGNLFVPLYELDWKSGNWSFKQKQKKLDKNESMRSAAYKSYLEQAKETAFELSGRVYGVPFGLDPDIVTFKF